MKHIGIFIGVVITLFSSIHAENSYITYIQDWYNKIQRLKQEDVESTKIKYQRVYPGTGECETTVQFYGEEFFTQEQFYDALNAIGDIKLHYVSVDYQVSCYPIKKEYLFDEKSQKLIFYYNKNEYNSLSKRLYFKNGKVIKIITKKFDDYGKEIESKVITSKFSKEDKKTASIVREKASIYVKQYPVIYTLEKLEKRGKYFDF